MTDAQGLSPTASKLERGIVSFLIYQGLAWCLAQLGAQPMILKEWMNITDVENDDQR